MIPVARRLVGAGRNDTGVAGVPAWTHDTESRSSMRWVNSRVIPARGASAGTEPPYGVGLRDGLYGQAGVALAFEMREMPPPCVQSHGGIAERSRMPLHELQAVYNLRASEGREMFNCFNNDRHGHGVRKAETLPGMLRG